MKTQITRDAYRPERHDSGVYQQQGRMLTDADWNALVEIVKRRLDDALADVVGSGAPRDGGFRVTQDPGEPLLFQGSRLYVGGVPAQVASPFAYENQPDFPGEPPLPLPQPPAQPQGTAFTLYADVWERTVVSLEDAEPWVADNLRDPALHGADTTTRTQTMAQVKWCPATDNPQNQVINPPLGDARLTVTLRASLGGADPCDPCAQVVPVALRVGNFLFRLEVHDVKGRANAPTEVTLKWSSENGAEQRRRGTEPTPADFTTGDFVYEFYNDVTEKLLGVHLATGFTPPRAQLRVSFPEDPPEEFDRVRRWDGFAVLQRNGEGNWKLATDADGTVQGKDRNVRLREDGDTGHGRVELSSTRLLFHLRELDLDWSVQGNRFVAGDYWLAPVRESVHKAGSSVLTNASPVGIIHHYLRLAEVSENGKLLFPSTGEEKLRFEFAPLSNLRAQDVSYRAKDDSGCAVLNPKIATVRDALDALCARPGGGLGCRVTVGQGGEFRTLLEAIIGLLSAERFDICLCLLPGQHVLAEDLILDDQQRGVHLSISGCGGGSRLILSGNRKIRITGIRSLRITELALEIAPDAQLAAEKCGDIALEGLVVTGPARAAGNEAIFLDALTSIRVAASRFRFLNIERVKALGNRLNDLGPAANQQVVKLFSDPLDDETFTNESVRVAEVLRTDAGRIAFGDAIHDSIPSINTAMDRSLRRFADVIKREDANPDGVTVALALRDLREVALQELPSVALALNGVSADTTVVDNHILGAVSIYGRARRLGEPDLTLDELKKLNRREKPTAGGRLSVVGNELSWLLVGGEMIDQLRKLAALATSSEVTISTYRVAYVAQNRFTAGGEISILAWTVHLTDNLFDGSVVVSGERRAGWVIAQIANYIGNGPQLFVDEQPAFVDDSVVHMPQSIASLNRLTFVSLGPLG